LQFYKLQSKYAYFEHNAELHSSQKNAAYVVTQIITMHVQFKPMLILNLCLWTFEDTDFINNDSRY